MKKVMIGILVLIPVIILLVVALVSAIVSIAAHIGVEDIDLTLKNANKENTLELSLSDDVYNLNDYINVVIAPAKATNRSVRWFVEELVYLDTEYETKYNQYIANKDDPDYAGEIVAPGVEFVNEKGEQIVDSSSGKIKINSYCYFYVKAQAEQKSARILVYVGGFDVKSAIVKGKNSVAVGGLTLLSSVFNPIDSIVNDVIWKSSDENVATVDQNGLLKGKTAGTTQITLKAKISSHEGNDPSLDYVTSAIFMVEVTSAVSVYGTTLTTDNKELSVSTLGLKNITENVNCTVVGDEITIDDTTKPASITADGGTFTITVCGKNDIVIDGANFFEHKEGEANGYVLPVGEIKLQLKASWESMTRVGTPIVTWQSSDDRVATINNLGVVTGKMSGYTTITAKNADGESTKDFVLNVQNKVTSVIIGTSIQSMAVGLARETVFGSWKYSDANMNDLAKATKVPNSVEIKFARPFVPVDADDKAKFFSAFTFEVDNANKDKAYFAENSNVLVFNPDKIKGRTSIKVIVKAKYPKYESFNSYTTTINVVDGVYIYADKPADTTINVVDGVYIYADKPADTTNKEEMDAYMMSLYTQLRCAEYEMNTKYEANPDQIVIPFAITLGGNVEMPDKGEGYYGYDWGESDGFRIRGSIYGNNYMISAGYKNMNGSAAVVQIVGNDSIVSNLQIRANRLMPGKEEITTPEGSKGLTGYTLKIQTDEYEKKRALNNRIEYSILENGCSVLNLQNADAFIEGCIFRNTSGVAIYAPTQMFRNEEGSLHTMYSNATLKNCVMSNLLGSAFSAHYKNYSTEDVDGKRVEREGWRTEYDKGHNTTLTQVGFLDLYNWQDVKGAQIIDAGNAELNSLIALLAGNAISTEDQFRHMRYQYADTVWLHMGVMTMGLADFPNWEDSYFEAKFEDKRFTHIKTSKIGGYSFIDANKGIHEISIYGYRNDVGAGNIIPGETYTIDSRLIDKLHGIGVGN